ncbi:MAG TPA: VWA domain-containing protein [Pyrinomonadaceae bacterium]|nr:VWA domain-containing protein [Pyrinomonadaceae bacterium]
MKYKLLVVALVVQLSPSGFAQQPAPSPQRPDTNQTQTRMPEQEDDEDVVRITTNLVQVDPVITDSKGKQVTDLRSDEVEILEDGKPQQITNFAYVALDSGQPTVPTAPVDRNAAPAPPLRLRPDQVRRTMALVVDDLGLSFESAYQVRRALKKFLDQEMQPNDLVAIIRTGGGIGALQQFTSDKRQLYAAVEKVKWNPSGRGGISAFAPISGTDLPVSRDEDEMARTTAGEDMDQFREDLFAVGTLGAINYVVRGLRELPGRKSVVLMSDGFKIFSRSSPEGNSRILTALRRLTDLANRASVVIYTIDARGLQTLGFTAADSTSGMSTSQVEQTLSNRRSDFFESQSGLSYLAQQTGGIAFRNTNDLAGGIRRVIEDQKGYYLIGYRPDEATFDTVSGRRKFHKLGLKVKRPGKFNVRMRNGFYGITDEEATPPRQTRVQQMYGALVSPFGSSGVHVRLTSLFANDPKAGSLMRSMLHVKGKDLTFTDEPDGWHKAVFDILAITFGDNGVVVDQIGRTHTMRVRGKVYERLLADGFTYNITVPVKKPGAYQLRTAVRDTASERLGSATQFIEVPDIKKNRLILSGIMLRGITPEVYKRGVVDTVKQDSDDTVDESDPNAHPAVRQFKSGLVMLYGLVIYNAQVQKTGKPQLLMQTKLFRNGQQVFEGKQIPIDTSNQTDLKRLNAAGAIQLGTEMEPGEYVIQIIVTDTLAKEKHRVVSQWIDFEVAR